MSSSSSSSSSSDESTPHAPLLKPQFQDNTTGYGGIAEDPYQQQHPQIVGQSKRRGSSDRKILGLSIGAIIAIAACFYCVTVFLPTVGALIYVIVAVAILGSY
uniref:Transmembrane protein n=1 Tax=Stereomyxa ramosa TaxID=1078864 RepID=A0A7S2EXM8_9EUKA|mmetsp:Transcript_750/g.942  ORF Transcript_750/g.942 Transcript_750/m.942 type:complete len:103 (+) Transcript_750:1-309(+)